MSKIPRDIWFEILSYLRPRAPAIVIRKPEDTRRIDPSVIEFVFSDGHIHITARTHYYAQSMFHSIDSNRYIQIGNPFVTCFCDFLNVEFLQNLRNDVIYGRHPLYNVDKKIYLLNNKILRLQYYPPITDITLPQLILRMEENMGQNAARLHGVVTSIQFEGVPRITEFIDLFIEQINCLKEVQVHSPLAVVSVSKE